MIPKGSGSENNSFLKMAVPAEGVDAIKTFVVDCVLGAGGKTCPPTIVGVGLGGTSDLCVLLAKRAATRPLGTVCDDPEGAALEQQLSAAVNQLGVGPQGLGGDSTAFAVHVELAATHITMNPIAVNMQCHSARRARATHHARAACTTASERSEAMAHHELSMPIDEAQVRALRVDDTVTLQRTLYGIRDATQIHLFDRGRTTRFDLRGHAVIHTAPNVRKAVEKSALHPGGLCADLHRHDDVRPHGALHPPADGAIRRAPDRRQGGTRAKARSPRSASSAAPTSRSSAAPRRSRPPGSSRSRTSISTT